MSNSSHTDPVTARAPYPFGQAGSGSTGRKISFRQLHNRTGARVRHTVCADVDHVDAAITAKEIPAEETVEETGANGVINRAGRGSASRHAIGSREARGSGQRLRFSSSVSETCDPELQIHTAVSAALPGADEEVCRYRPQQVQVIIDREFHHLWYRAAASR